MGLGSVFVTLASRSVYSIVQTYFSVSRCFLKNGLHLRVPTAESRMGPGELPQFLAHSNASPEAFGSGVAKATQNLGAVVGEMAGLVDKYAEMEEEDKYRQKQLAQLRDQEALKHGGTLSDGSVVTGYANGNYDPDEVMGQLKKVTGWYDDEKWSRRLRYKKGNEPYRMVNESASSFVEFNMKKSKEKAVQDYQNAEIREQNNLANLKKNGAPDDEILTEINSSSGRLIIRNEDYPTMTEETKMNKRQQLNHEIIIKHVNGLSPEEWVVFLDEVLNNPERAKVMLNDSQRQGMLTYRGKILDSLETVDHFKQIEANCGGDPEQYIAENPNLFKAGGRITEKQLRESYRLIYHPWVAHTYRIKKEENKRKANECVIKTMNL